jgi:RNA polymerase sigma factor (sigma-70 family)
VTAPDPTIRGAVEEVWRLESAKVVGRLARLVGDVGMAEELAQDALVAALEQWPRDGVPSHPASWLMATAKHRAVDALRRQATYRRKLVEVGRSLPDDVELETNLDDVVGDDVLRLVFMACHPVLAPDAQVALTLKVVAGLSTAEIARAFLVPEATVAQRIVRAKKGLAGLPYELPPRDELGSRLESVLAVVYLVFTEGYAATAGDDWTRPELCNEAMRLGRLLAEIVPDESEVHGLLALMELQASRIPARVGPSGEAVLLPDQDRSRWDALLVRRGLESLEQAESLGGAARPYTLQAAIAACHARAVRAADTNWKRIAALYTVLAHVSPSPIVQLNRAVAVAEAEGPAAGLALVDALVSHQSLRSYALLPAVRGDLLARLGHDAEARQEFARAAELTANEQEQQLFLARAGGISALHAEGQIWRAVRDSNSEPAG